MKDIEKKCDKCYWCSDDLCLLFNKEIKVDSSCDDFKERCYNCHKKLGRNFEYYLFNSKAEKVCSKCHSSLLLKDLFNAYNEIEKLKQRLDDKQTSEDFNDLIDEDYLNRIME